jgi:hypothetical protein
MENGGLALKQKSISFYEIFWHVKMILQYKMLQTTFSMLKKHSPSNLYMLYPMMQSVALIGF